ncbi:hypothetical protein BDR06DRAFT_1015760 [Suillus hirtellus]|nr:hypothetical protein BDR06DRAFT_1015760 [Suillus hirtellus]
MSKKKKEVHGAPSPPALSCVASAARHHTCVVGETSGIDDLVMTLFLLGPLLWKKAMDLATWDANGQSSERAIVGPPRLEDQEKHESTGGSICRPMRQPFRRRRLHTWGFQHYYGAYGKDLCWRHGWETWRRTFTATSSVFYAILKKRDGCQCCGGSGKRGGMHTECWGEVRE